MAGNDERKRQKKLARKRKKSAQKKAQKAASQPLLPKHPQELAKFILDPKKMTTPKQIDDNVTAFCASINPDFEPVTLEITPEDWCRQSCCNLNVAEIIKADGGELLCGYKIWYHEPYYIEGERHAIHRSDDGVLRDPTFAADGETKIVFVADVPERSTKFDDNVDKKRSATDPAVQSLVNTLNDHERRNPIRKLSDAQSWATMQTYADWKAGKRQASVWVEGRRKNAR